MSDLEKIIQRIEDKLSSLERTREQIKQELEAERAQLDSIDKALASLRSVESKVAKKVAKK